jgi:hypothetical protein
VKEVDRKRGKEKDTDKEKEQQGQRFIPIQQSSFKLNQHSFNPGKKLKNEMSGKKFETKNI